MGSLRVRVNERKPGGEAASNRSTCQGATPTGPLGAGPSRPKDFLERGGAGRPELKVLLIGLAPCAPRTFLGCGCRPRARVWPPGRAGSVWFAGCPRHGPLTLFGLAMRSFQSVQSARRLCSEGRWESLCSRAFHPARPASCFQYRHTGLGVKRKKEIPVFLTTKRRHGVAFCLFVSIKYCGITLYEVYFVGRLTSRRAALSPAYKGSGLKPCESELKCGCGVWTGRSCPAFLSRS